MMWFSDYINSIKNEFEKEGISIKNNKLDKWENVGEKDKYLMYTGRDSYNHIKTLDISKKPKLIGTHEISLEIFNNMSLNKESIDFFMFDRYDRDGNIIDFEKIIGTFYGTKDNKESEFLYLFTIISLDEKKFINLFKEKLKNDDEVYVETSSYGEYKKVKFPSMFKKGKFHPDYIRFLKYNNVFTENDYYSYKDYEDKIVLYTKTELKKEVMEKCSINKRVVKNLEEEIKIRKRYIKIQEKQLKDGKFIL